MLCFLAQTWTCMSLSVVLWDLSQREIGKYYICLPTPLTVQANISTLSSVIWLIPPRGFSSIRTVCNLCPDRIHYFLPQISFFFFFFGVSILSWQFLTSDSQFNRLPSHVPLCLEENLIQSLQSLSLWNTFGNSRIIFRLFFFILLYNFIHNLYKFLITDLWNTQTFKAKVCLCLFIYDVYMCIHATAHKDKPEENLFKLLLLFHEGPGDLTQFIKLGGQAVLPCFFSLKSQNPSSQFCSVLFCFVYP